MPNILVRILLTLIFHQNSEGPPGLPGLPGREGQAGIPGVRGERGPDGGRGAVSLLNKPLPNWNAFPLYSDCIPHTVFHHSDTTVMEYSNTTITAYHKHRHHCIPTIFRLRSMCPKYSVAGIQSENNWNTVRIQIGIQLEYYNTTVTVAFLRAIVTQQAFPQRSDISIHILP